MLIRKIYEDNVIGRLPDRLFQSMLTDYENEQNELNKIIETDTADMQRIIGGQNNVERFLKLVKKYENITELTPAMINEFIDGLKVGRTGMACCPFHSDKSPSMSWMNAITVLAAEQPETLLISQRSYSVSG